MNHKQRVGLALLLAGALTSFSGSSAEERPPKPEVALDGVQSGLEQSPDRFVAALVEVAALPACDEKCAAAICVEDVKLVRVIAARGDLAQGTTIKILGRGSVGERMLGFFVPTVEGSPVFRATFATGLTGESEVQVLVDALEAAGVTKPPA